MNRYYICRRLGNGVPGDPYNSELRQYVQDTYEIKPKQQVISHTFPYVLHKYDLTQPQHDDVVANVPQIFSFPAGALDRELSSINAQQRTAIRTRLENAGFDMSWVTGGNTIREVLQFIAHSIQLSEITEVDGPLSIRADATSFNIRTLAVGDVPAEVRQRLGRRLEEQGIDTSDITLSTPLWQVVRKFQRMADGVTPRMVGERVKRRLLYHDAEAE